MGLNPHRKWHSSPHFLVHVLLWSNGWLDQDITWYEIGLGPGDIVLDRDPALSLPEKMGAQQFLQFWIHVYCGQTAAWIKMSLGKKVNLGPGDIVLDGNAAPPKEHSSPQFLAHVYCGQTL